MDFTFAEQDTKLNPLTENSPISNIDYASPVHKTQNQILPEQKETIIKLAVNISPIQHIDHASRVRLLQNKFTPAKQINTSNSNSLCPSNLNTTRAPHAQLYSNTNSHMDRITGKIYSTMQNSKLLLHSVSINKEFASLASQNRKYTRRFNFDKLPITPHHTFLSLTVLKT